jgi:hypothetical protein
LLKTVSQVGSWVTGNTAPERKNMGGTNSWVTNWKDWTSDIRAANITPKAVGANAVNASSRSSTSSMSGL